MKNHIQTIVLLCISALLSQNLAAQNVKLSGTIISPNTDSVFLQYSERGENGWEVIVLASGALNKQGEFQLETSLDSAKSVMFYDGLEATSLYLLPGDDIQMSLHTAYFDETIQFYGKGAERNNAIAALAIVNEVNSSSLASLVEKLDTTTLFERIDKITLNVQNTIDGYAEQFPEMSTVWSGKKKQAEAAAKRQKSNVVSKLKFNALKEELVGKELLDIVGVNMEGKEVSLSRFKGKTTVVDFWATWCGPCKAEMPHLKTLEDKYGEEVNFVSVGTFCKEEDWKKMAEEFGFEYNMFVSKENGKYTEQYMVNSIPRYMVIDKDLNIISIDAPRPSSGDLEKLF